MTEIETRRLGNLAIVAPLLERMNVKKIFNQHLPSGTQLDFDYGTVLQLLIAARLFGPTPLSRVTEWAAESGAELVFGVPAEKLNDDRLGRALDQLFSQRHSILASISLHVSEAFDIPLDALHYDPTHLVFTGAYEQSEPREQRAVTYDQGEMSVVGDADLQAIHITKGKPVDDAPTGCRMAHFGLATFVDQHGPVPMTGHMLDGNENGRSGMEEQLGLIVKYLKPAELTVISDRGTYSVAHMLRMNDQGFKAICSVPWSDVEKQFDLHLPALAWQSASYLSIEQRRRRESSSTLPLEEYKLASVQHEFRDSTSKRKIDCRVIFVHSTADEKVTRKQRDKQLQKVKAGLEKCRLNVQRRGPYSTPADVSRRMARLLASPAIAKYITWQMVALDDQTQVAEKMEGRGNRNPTHEFQYSIDEQAIEQAKHYDGYSAIVTNLTAAEKSDDEAFSKFKQQTYSEVCNSVLKDPKNLAVRPVFLHNPERIEALSFLMIIALMAHYLVQREYRKQVPEDAPEKEKRVTTQQIFRAYRSYTIVIEKRHNQTLVRPTRLTTKQQRIVQRIRLPSPAEFLKRKLPPA